MHLVLLKYTVLRLALFVASLVVLWLVGVRQSILMLVLAGVISLGLSYLLLRRQREELARVIAQRVESRLHQSSADMDSEDAALDRVEAQQRAERAGQQAGEAQRSAELQAGEAQRSAEGQRSAEAQRSAEGQQTAELQRSAEAGQRARSDRQADGE